MVLALTAPAVLAKYERVHNEGNFFKIASNSRRKWKEGIPFSSLTTSAALSEGHTRTKIGICSGWIAKLKICHHFSLHFPSIRS
jgi:hypothetical protein